MGMREHDYKTIHGLDLFRDMTEDRFSALVHGALFRHFPVHVELATEGKPANFLYVLVEGRVKLLGSAGGKATTIKIVEPVATFLLAAVVLDAPFLMSARTIEPCRVLMVPASNVRHAFATSPSFTLAATTELAARYRELVKAIKNQKLRTSAERLANYLLTHHNAQGSNGGASLVIDKAMLASLLGMTPENLSRAFASLRGYGVEVKGSGIRLTNLKDLETFAKPLPLIDDPAA
jgi:CRP/FNR family transcriptional regulator, transcriptional activator FtrB